MSTYWQAGIVVVGLLMLAWLLWSEVKRPNRSWLWPRVLASVVAVTSLVLLAIPINISVAKTPGSNRQAILLTPGYNADSVGVFIASQQNNPPVFYLAGKGFTAGVSNAIALDGVRFLPLDKILQLHIFGEGLGDTELSMLSDLPVVYHPGKTPQGVQSISWSRQLQAGEKLTVQGQYQNNKNIAVKLILSAFNTVADSATIAPNSTTRFHFATVPQQQGNATFNLVSMVGNDTLAADPLPVLVLPLKPIAVLLLSSSPNFDTRFLKSQLGQYGYPVAVRTAISKNKYATEFINLPVTGLQTISEKLLNQFDVIVADATELAALPEKQLGAIKNNVSDKGLGLLIKTDSALKGRLFYNTLFSLTQTTIAAPETVAILADSSLVLPPLNMGNLLLLKSQPGVLPLVNNSKGEVLAGEALFGRGKVGLTTLPNSWQWLLAGNNRAYQQYWTWLLQNISRPTSLKRTIWLEDNFAMVDEPSTIQLSDTINGNNVIISGNTVAMEQHALLLFNYSGSVWLQKSGWQTIGNNSQQIAPGYVFAKTDFVAARSVIISLKTSTFSQSSKKNTLATTAANTKTKPLPLCWMIGMFLLAATFLWLEKKFL